MRVLLVTHLFPPDGVAGVERYTEMLAAGLAAVGDTVTIATRRRDGASRIDTVCDRLADGTQVHRYAGGSLDLASFLRDHARIEELFTRTLVRCAPDVVHVNHLIGLSPRVIEIVRRFRIPLVLSLHDFYAACPVAHLKKTDGRLCDGPDAGRECAATCFAGERDARLRWGLRAAYFRRLLAVADRLTVPSPFVGEYLVAFGADRQRLHVVPCGIERRHAAGGPQAPPGDRLVVAYVGVVGAAKGVHLIVEALAAARLGPVELRVVGQLLDPPYAESLRRAAARVPGLELRLVGTFEPAELPDLLRGAHASVVPSLVPETFCLTAREALTQGIPVVASRIGALPDVVEDGRNGLLFTPGNVTELATALRRLATDGELRAPLAAGALATPHLSVADHVALVRGLYTDILVPPQVAETAADAAERSFLFDSMLAAGFADRPLPPRIVPAVKRVRLFGARPR